MHHRTLVAAGLTSALAVTAVPILAGSAAASSGSSRATVSLKNFKFAPSRISIRKGGTVTFVWRDGSIDHNVTSSGGARFRSSSTKHSGTYSVRLTKAGSYRFECTLHPGSMQGVITVR